GAPGDILPHFLEFDPLVKIRLGSRKNLFTRPVIPRIRPRLKLRKSRPAISPLLGLLAIGIMVIVGGASVAVYLAPTGASHETLTSTVVWTSTDLQTIRSTSTAFTTRLTSVTNSTVITNTQTITGFVLSTLTSTSTNYATGTTTLTSVSTSTK